MKIIAITFLIDDDDNKSILEIGDSINNNKMMIKVKSTGLAMSIMLLYAVAYMIAHSDENDVDNEKDNH